MSAIAKCVGNNALDERPIPIKVVSGVLCLDGQRRVLVKGTEGSSGAEYNTIPDSFTR